MKTKNWKKRKGQVGLFIIFFLLFIYVVFQFVIFFFYPTVGWITLTVGYISNILILLLYLKTRNKRNNKDIVVAWSVGMMIFPFVGTVWYFVGSFLWPSKKSLIHDTIKFEAVLNEKNSITESKMIETNSLFEVNKINYSSNVVENSRTLALKNSTEYYSKLIEDLNSAKKIIMFQSFILNDGIIWNTIKKILIEKKKSGVEVYVNTDFVGNVQTHNNAFKVFKKNNIDCCIFNKVTIPFTSGFANFRNHNKTIVIDGRVAYSGGMNIGDDYSNLYPKYGKWADLSFRFTGEIVREFTKNFIVDWFFSTRKDISKFMDQMEFEPERSNEKIQLIPDGPIYNQARYLENFIRILKDAKKDVKIISPYIVLPTEIYNEIVNAHKRGVNVSIITAGLADKKSAYFLGKFDVERLTSEGIKVYRAENIFVHAKSVVVDDEIALVGTSNLDYRSIFHHIETNVLTDSRELIRDLNKFRHLLIENSYLDDVYYSDWGFIKKTIYFLSKPISTMF